MDATSAPKERNNDYFRIAIVGSLIVVVILTFGTYALGKVASRDTQEAVRNVSLMYLGELAERWEQVVSSILDDYINDMDVAIGLIDKENLSSTESLQSYQARMKELYGLDKFAFVDENGLIYTSRGTRSDIDQYKFDYTSLTEPEISIKNLESIDKKVIIAVPVDNLPFEGHQLVVCFMEIDMDHMLQDVSLKSDNNTTFCNIYTPTGVALTDLVLGGLASEDNLLEAMEHADYEEGYSQEKLKEDFQTGKEGVVSFTYNDISETLYYVPIHNTDWMLTYLIRESVIGEQIGSISNSIIKRSLIQSILTALVLAGMFSLMILQTRQAARARLEKEVSEAENRVKQQELEEQVAMQEELLEQEKKRVEQDSMITALASDYRSVYYVDLDKDDAICYRKEAGIATPFSEGQHFPFLKEFIEYGNRWVAESYRDEFLKFINPDSIRKGLERESVISFRYLVVKDGRESYEMLRIAGVRLQSGKDGQPMQFEKDDKVLHAIGVGFTDIDAQMRESMAKSEQLAEALRAAETANRAKSGFVSNMSHEIRTPITAILGMNEMIKRESGDKSILPYAENIRKAGESLLGIISDILDFSKIEAGRMELSQGAYLLSELVRDLYNLIRFRAEAKGLEFKVSVDPLLPKGLVGDELRVKQIILNLLTNAVKYTEKGSVFLEISQSPEPLVESGDSKECIRLYVAVTDTGIGIRKEDMDKLFSAFDRLDPQRTRSIEGTGLGLSITRQLLNMMDSELYVESTYNEGSKFYFSLCQGISDPGAIGDYDPEMMNSALVYQEEDGKPFKAPGRRILVVDDTPMNLQVIAGLLKRTLMTVETAPGGKECIEMFGKNDYDLVFLDYRMSGLDGIDTILQLKKLYPEKFKTTPVISLTASAVSGDREKLLAFGFTDYLPKPVNIADMERMLRKYIAEEAQIDSVSGFDAAPEDSADSNLMQALGDIPLLNPKKGIVYCGDEEDYIFALQTYKDSISEKADSIEKCLKEGDLDTYALTVHSLKSTSASIGASTLSERAKFLEEAARNHDREKLESETPSFLKDYRGLGEELGRALVNHEI